VGALVHACSTDALPSPTWCTVSALLEYEARARQQRDAALREMVPVDGYDDSDF
jgi:hypothetical protein